MLIIATYYNLNPQSLIVSPVSALSPLYTSPTPDPAGWHDQPPAADSRARRCSLALAVPAVAAAKAALDTILAQLVRNIGRLDDAEEERERERDTERKRGRERGRERERDREGE